MAQHHFHYSATWSGGRNAVGDMEAGALKTQISIATGMGGPGVGTNPDEMLLGAAATCYLMTLAAMIERAELPLRSLSLKSEITIDVTNGAYRCKHIIHHPCAVLADGADATARQRLDALLVAAEQRCMVSNALRNNVQIDVIPAAL